MHSRTSSVLTCEEIVVVQCRAKRCVVKRQGHHDDVDLPIVHGAYGGTSRVTRVQIRSVVNAPVPGSAASRPYALCDKRMVGLVTLILFRVTPLLALSAGTMRRSADT